MTCRKTTGEAIPVSIAYELQWCYSANRLSGLAPFPQHLCAPGMAVTTSLDRGGSGEHSQQGSRGTKCESAAAYAGPGRDVQDEKATENDRSWRPIVAFRSRKRIRP